MSSQQPALFVSYRRSQLASVQPVATALDNAGVRCFLDVEAIDPLADFPARICSGIDRSHAMLVWWSRDYGDSDLCLQELRRGWQHARRHSSDLARRIWVVNPEATAHHVFAGEIDRENFLKAPSAGDEASWIELLRKRLQDLLPEGPLADERHAEPVPSFYNVPAKSSQFTGRSRELMRMHSKLHPVRIGAQGAAVAVQTHGMGGVGKTELATAYARDFSMAYPGGVYWLNLAGWNPSRPAREGEAQSAWLRAVEQTFQLTPELTQKLLRDAEGKVLSPPVARERLAKALGNQAEYLWILDNVPELSPLDVRATILEFIRAPTSAGRTLLTTRDGRKADGFAEESLEVLSDEEALRLLAQFRPAQARAELDSMREIVAAVGAHTQALLLLGEHAREAPGGYPRVAQRVTATGRLQHIEAIAGQLAELLGDKARGILATFQLSIAALSASEQELLSLTAVCATNFPIPDELLLAAFGGAEREDLFAAALAGLIRRSLLSRRAAATHHVFIHPLIADATLRLLKVDVGLLRERLGDALLSRLTKVEDIRAHASLAHDVEQARALGGLLEDRRGVTLLLRVGQFEQERGQYTDARAIEEQALSLAIRVLGHEDTETLAARNNLAQTLRAQGDLSGARELQELVLSICRRVLGAEDQSTLVAMSNLALTLNQQGNLRAALELEEPLLAIRRRVLGEEDPDTLGSMSNLGETLRALGDLKRARELHEQALSIRRRVLGPEDVATLTSMNNLALTLRDEGDLSGSRTLSEQVLASHRQLLGEEHVDTLRSMNNLAVTLSELGDQSTARALHEAALSVRQRKLGKEHPDTTVTAWNLCLTLLRLGATELAVATVRDHLLWLIDRDPGTLSGDQKMIRDGLIERMGISDPHGNV